MEEGVVDDVVVLEELLLQVRRDVVKCCASIGVFGVAARTRRRELMRTEKAIACATRIERAVHVEKRVSLGNMSRYS